MNAGSLPARPRSSVAVAIAAIVVGLGLLAGLALYARSSFGGVPQTVRHGVSSNPARIAPWMTVRYISRTYNVPEDVLLQALHIDAAQARGRSLHDIARMQHMTDDQVLRTVRTAVREYRLSTGATPVPRRPVR